jgi:hypothetical protein
VSDPETYCPLFKVTSAYVLIRHYAKAFCLDLAYSTVLTSIGDAKNFPDHSKSILIYNFAVTVE